MDTIIMDHGVIQPVNKPLRRRRRVKKLGTLQEEERRKWESSIDELITIVGENRLNQMPAIEHEAHMENAEIPAEQKAEISDRQAKAVSSGENHKSHKGYTNLILGILCALFSGVWLFLMLSVFGADLHIVAKVIAVVFCGFTMYLNFSESCRRIFKALRMNRREKT